MLTKAVTVDLFNLPQRERIREQAVRLAMDKSLSYQQIAERNSEKPPYTEVGNALRLDLMMRSLGLTNPYAILLKPPEDYSKLRRHENEKYNFEPLKGYQRPPL